MTPDVIALRAQLEAVQSRESHHRNIGATLTVSARVGRLPMEMTGTTAIVCPSCPSRRECRNASLRLAEAETRVIGGDHA